MSSKEVWLVEGYQVMKEYEDDYDDGYENPSEVELSEAHTSEDKAVEAAKAMAEDDDNLNVYVTYTRTVNGRTEQSYLNSDGTYNNDEGEPW